MAKTTRKAEPNAGEKKPAARRTKAAGQPAGAENVTARRRSKAAPEAATIQAASVEPAAAQVSAPEPTHDEIALRAWSIYRDRGGSHGEAMNDWLEAKRQLFAERGLQA